MNMPGLNEISESLEKNKDYLKQHFPIGVSFDFIVRDLLLGNTKALWIGISGFCNTEILQRIFSDLQDPQFMDTPEVGDLPRFVSAKIGYAQVTLTSSWDDVERSLLSGPSILFVDGSAQAVVIDARSYPTRGVDEPDTEKVTRGSRDGFVETLLFNTNLIRRRVRSADLAFEIRTIGSVSKTDVAVGYLSGEVNRELLRELHKALDSLDVTSLTMGSKSLEELLVKKRWYNPLPSIQMTERPDVACSYLTEGHILVIVDNTPSVLILPCTIFQFTQSPEDYYKNPSVGTYFRLVRFGCIIASLLLLPLFLLLTAWYPDTSGSALLPTGSMGPMRIFFYVVAVEFLLDLFKYSTSHSSDRFSGALAIVGGLIIGDIAVELNWASVEVMFYAAVTLLTTLALPNIEFGDAIRLYRILLILATGFFGPWGFGICLVLVILSIATTPTFARMSYFWPLFPFNWPALKTLLFRFPTFKAQPIHAWKRHGKKHHTKT